MSTSRAEQALVIYHRIRQEVSDEWTTTSIHITAGMAVLLILMVLLWISYRLRQRKEDTRRDTLDAATQRKKMNDATMTELPHVLVTRLGIVAHQRRNSPTLQKALIVDLTQTMVPSLSFVFLQCLET